MKQLILATGVLFIYTADCFSLPEAMPDPDNAEGGR